MNLTLPKGSRLEAIYESLSPEGRGALAEHLLGGTEAKWLARNLTECGFSITEASIRRTRESLKGGVQL